MDFTDDDAGIRESDFDSVFRYAARESTVVEMLARDSRGPVLSTLQSSDDIKSDQWPRWLAQLAEKMDNTQGDREPCSGLVLIMARRAGEATTEKLDRASETEWLQCLDRALPPPDSAQALSDKAVQALASLSASGKVPRVVKQTSSRRGVRTLPFSHQTFKLLTRAFRTHGTIARAISRSDAPLCSVNEVHMKEPAYVYNCRSSNAWDHDLALSATYFPQRRLTMAIFYGTTIDLERNIVHRLRHVSFKAMHPLLLPGIFIELERARHANLVTKTILMLEQKIMESQVSIDDLKGRIDSQDKHKRNELKRSAWLDTLYLKNGLITWTTQIRKMVQHVQELDEQWALEEPRGPPERVDSNDSNDSQRTAVDVHDMADMDGMAESDGPHGRLDGARCGTTLPSWADGFDNDITQTAEPEATEESTTRDVAAPDTDGVALRGCPKTTKMVGRRIKERLLDIQDEYEDWVRDCTMRVDGMTMATQWFSGEISVEIALSTRRDSKYMRSIAVLTMIYLPGTWLAGVFSMTFFEWNTDNGSPHVSRYIWIYMVATFILTTITVGCWYYLIVLRPKGVGRCDDEDEENLKKYI